MKDAELSRELKSGSVGGLYFFWGEEDYLKNRRAAEMKKAALGGDETLAAFNCAEFVFGDGEFDEAAVENALLSSPMMGFAGLSAGKKFVSLTFSSVDSLKSRGGRTKEEDGDADGVNGNGEQEPKEKEEEKGGGAKNRLLEFLKAAPVSEEDTVVVVKAVSGGFDGGTEKRPSPFLREAEKFMKVVEFPCQPESRLIRWMERHFAEYGLTPEPQVCPWILRSAGRSMYRLSGELTKTAAYAAVRIEEREKGAPRVVTLNDAKECVTASDEDDAFGLANCMTDGDAAGALRYLRIKMANREDPSMILGQISRAFTDLYAAACFAADGRDASDFAKTMKMNEWRAKICYRAASKVSPGRYAEAIRLCLEADRQLKSRAGGGSTGIGGGGSAASGSGVYAPIERLVCLLTPSARASSVPPVPPPVRVTSNAGGR